MKRLHMPADMLHRCNWLLVSCLCVSVTHHKTSSADAAPADTTTAQGVQSQQHKISQRTTKYQPPDMESGGVTCYTCVNVSDNLMCNRYAIDHPCPRGESFCHTLHIMDSTGASVVVNKKCANPSECSSERVGCLQIDTQKVCVSCCDAMYCNMSVPTNQSNTVFYTKKQHQQHQQQHHSAGCNIGRHGLGPSLLAVVVLLRRLQ